ncbi:endonuclease V [Flavobacterium sp.]|uniref:endonuclease V n=1 Tax=Flavobacterium sp. TaxID=239 RepID=UPI0008BD12ED|nr:endonuclease V [Flavobacterium sp.]OGS62486.1 MAG: endonuclease V [Flavobacteria bacterium GWF1_32_7]HBD27419.1 endonuclease V [Flavobacterium sp.]
MILAFDTYYFENNARTVCIQFERWNDCTITNFFEETISEIEEYKSGEFYKRELPCILSLLKSIDLSECEAIIIDGFVVIDDNQNDGLGGYLFKSLNCKIPIIGVAKNNFSKIEEFKKEILRGESKKPLYITSKGINLDKAAELIKKMDGKFRIPDLLKKVDSLGRNIDYSS